MSKTSDSDPQIGESYYVYFINRETLNMRIYLVKVVDIDHVQYFCEVVESSDGNDVGDMQTYFHYELFAGEKDCLERALQAADNLKQDISEQIEKLERRRTRAGALKSIIRTNIDNIKPKLRAV